MTTLPASPPPHSPSPAHRPTVASDSANWAIDLHDVAKTFKGKKGPIHALNGIDMRVPAGSIFGLLGPNGAGKSTLVKILMTVIRPTRCRGTMLGKPVGHKPSLARIGYLPEHHRFPDYLTAEQILDHFGAMAQVPRHLRRERVQPLLDLVGIGQWSNAKVKGFSKGMRQRLGIANALINDPDLILLDEPTDGVDPVGRRDIRNVLFELKKRGKTVFLNSHLLSELEMVCDHVAILVQGKVSSQGTVDELTRRSVQYEIEVQFPNTPPTTFNVTTDATVTAVLHQSLAQLMLLGPATADEGHTSALNLTDHRGEPIQLSVSGSSLRLSTSDPVTIQPVLDALRSKGLVIRSIRPTRDSLEDLFMKAVIDPETGRELKPGAKLDPDSGRTTR